MAKKNKKTETAEEQLQAARKSTPDGRIMKIAELESRMFRNDGAAITPYLTDSAVLAAVLGLIGALVLSNSDKAGDFWGISLLALAIVLVLCLLGYTLLRQQPRYAQGVRDAQELCIYRLTHEEVANPEDIPTVFAEEDKRIRLWLFNRTSTEDDKN